MAKASKVIFVGYCIILGNILLLGLYLRTYTATVYIIKKELRTTIAYRINTIEAPTVSGICQNKTQERLMGPVRPNLARAAELYWIHCNLSRPLRNHEHFLGTFTELPESELKGKVFLNHDRGCANYTVAIIVPFRDREHHLQILLGHLAPILRRQGLRFTVFVVEQEGTGTFNKGRLMNTGFEFAAKLGRDAGMPYDCFIFQDVDLLVEHDTLLYRCSDSDDAIRHLSTAIDKFKYKAMCCGMTVGGVLAFREHQFRDVNGFPNSLWGWGGEDDDMNARIALRQLKIERPSPILGRFTMIHHNRDTLNPANNHRYLYLRNIESRLSKDGLSNLDTNVTKIQLYPLFVKITVKVGTSPFNKRSSIIIRYHRRKDAFSPVTTK